MIQKMITFLPEILLLVGIFTMFFVQRFRTLATPKTYSTIARSFIILALIFTIILYNHSGYPHYYENSLYTSLFKSIIFVLAVLWGALSCKWFLLEDKSSYRFYSLCLGTLAALSLMISSLNLLIVSLAWITIQISYIQLLRLSPDLEEQPKVYHYYIGSVLFFIVLLCVGCFLIEYNTQSLNYTKILAFLQKSKTYSPSLLLGIGCFLAVFLFSLLVAPFHLWYLDFIKTAILPVSGWITLIPLFGYFACFVDWTVNVFKPVYPLYENILLVMAMLSLFIGVSGANGENNLRRLFGFSSIFHMGILLVSLMSFSENNVFGAFVYLFVYVLSMMGIYTVFLGMRCKGISAESLDEISGLSASKPYLSAALLLLMMSLMGMPPMMGFLGKLSVINNLVIEQHYYLVGIVLLSLLFMANAYLRVLKYVYFNHLNVVFDRTDKGIYIFLFVNLLVVMIFLFHPRLLMNDFEKMLITVF